MAAVKNEGKTAFVQEVLEKNPRANARAVNEAWTEAGHGGSISETLVSKVRSSMGLTGNLRSRSQSAEGGETARQPKGAPTARKKRPELAPVSSEEAPPLAEERTPAPSEAAGPVRSQSDEESPDQMLDELEDGIDDLIYKLKGAGGRPEVVEALRRARRLLYRDQS